MSRMRRARPPRGRESRVVRVYAKDEGRQTRARPCGPVQRLRSGDCHEALAPNLDRPGSHGGEQPTRLGQWVTGRRIPWWRIPWWWIPWRGIPWTGARGGRPWTWLASAVGAARGDVSRGRSSGSCRAERVDDAASPGAHGRRCAKGDSSDRARPAVADGTVPVVAPE